MRRGLVLAGMWAIGVVASVALAFAAVAWVASGVAPRDTARLSKTAIDDELTSRTTQVPGASTTTSVKPGSTSTTTSTSPLPSSPTTSGPALTPTTGTVPITTSPPVTSISSTVQTLPSPTVTTVTTAPAPHNTVTTSQGGTVYSRCTSADKILFVAAVPKSGYQRTVDGESPDGIKQRFTNSHHSSTIQAECSHGSVHAEVDEESGDD